MCAPQSCPKSAVRCTCRSLRKPAEQWARPIRYFGTIVSVHICEDGPKWSTRAYAQQTQNHKSMIDCSFDDILHSRGHLRGPHLTGAHYMICSNTLVVISICKKDHTWTTNLSCLHVFRRVRGRLARAGQTTSMFAFKYVACSLILVSYFDETVRGANTQYLVLP